MSCLIQVFLFQSCGSDSDLIKLDDSPNDLEDFDPLKKRDKGQKGDHIKTSTDSALLHEYGLDFSQFGLLGVSAGSSSQPEPNTGVPKGWTTFN